MPTRNTRHRYGWVAMLFHWTIAAFIFTNFPLGIYFSKFLQRGSPQWLVAAQLHVVIGTAVLALSFLRLGWRLMNPLPASPYESGNMRKLAVDLVHYGLYTLMIAVPLIGWGLLSLSPRPVVLFGTGPWPKFQLLASLPAASKEAVSHTLGAGHAIGAVLLVALALGHVAAAVFYHHFIRKDQVLLRMIPGTEIRA